MGKKLPSVYLDLKSRRQNSNSFFGRRSGDNGLVCVVGRALRERLVITAHPAHCLHQRGGMDRLLRLDFVKSEHSLEDPCDTLRFLEPVIQEVVNLQVGRSERWMEAIQDSVNFSSQARCSF